jgi:hypothetical protein
MLRAHFGLNRSAVVTAQTGRWTFYETLVFILDINPSASLYS